MRAKIICKIYFLNNICFTNVMNIIFNLCQFLDGLCKSTQAKIHIYNMIIIRNIYRNQNLGRLSLYLLSNFSTKQEFLDKLSKKKYLEILGLNEKDKLSFKGKDLHRVYLSQVKRYHSDKVNNQQSKKQYDEITKCITMAYEQLKKEQDGYRGGAKSQSEMFFDQEEVAQNLFNKSYVEIKHTLYATGNQQMKSKFLEQLKKVRNNRYPNGQQKPQSQSQSPPRSSSYGNQNYYQSQSSNSNTPLITIFGVICLAMIPFLYQTSKPKKVPSSNKQSKNEVGQQKTYEVRNYTQKQYDIIQQNTKKLAAKPLQRFYNNILQKRPHMLNYPTGQDPHIIDQLTDYSIAQDIHLYEVPSKYFLNRQEQATIKQINQVNEIKKYELTETKPNTLMSLSLQAERVLHNIYINVDDVLAEIKQKGKYTPPKIFFRFHGFIMFQIRDKPFSNLIGYRNSRYISLFDLYFDYYSPIFFKRNYYNQYLVGFQKEDAILYSRYFGHVHLNHRPIPHTYIEKDEKVVFMKNIEKSFDPSGLLKDYDSKYQEDWQSYYQRFQKNWKKYCQHQVNNY